MQRMASGWLAAFLAVAVAGCGVTVEESESAERRVTEVRLAELANAEIPEQWLREQWGGRQEQAASMLEVEKIANGTDIDYDTRVGRGVVFIASTQNFCTAQVINRYFLLTAAHCVEAIFSAFSDEIAVGFTKSNGDVVSLYWGWAYGIAHPNWDINAATDEEILESVPYDIGLVFIENGLSTCDGDFGTCEDSKPDKPMNAVFQGFGPNVSSSTEPQTTTALGYGTEDDETGWGVFRKGSVTIDERLVNGEHVYLLTRWDDEDDARVCNGDSGGPLVVPGTSEFGRPFYMGIYSLGQACPASSGESAHLGLSQPKVEWIAYIMEGLRDDLDLSFECVANPYGLSIFFCSNHHR